MKFFVFSTSHGHTGAGAAKGDKDDYRIRECAMRGEVEQAGIVQPGEQKVQAGYKSHTYKYQYIKIPNGEKERSQSKTLACGAQSPLKKQLIETTEY